MKSSISVISPVYNEEASIRKLFDKLYRVLEGTNEDFEIIFVDDGSTDNSLKELKEIAKNYHKVKVISFRINQGQTAAMQAGIDHASYDIIVPIDADLQNDPKDIPRLIKKLKEGYDVVSGWRKNRKDSVIRLLPSIIANYIISWISGIKLHDYGCTLKAYKRDIISDISLYGEMHRFIPIYASWQGAKVTELVVKHYSRKYGSSKYGLERTIKVILDLLVIKFIKKQFTKPIYVFGGFGILSLFLSFIVSAIAFYLKFFHSVSLILTPLPLVATMFFLSGVTSILLGLLAEMLTRTYFESQKKRIYSILRKINLD